jgi:hypothetical protein
MRRSFVLVLGAAAVAAMVMGAWVKQPYRPPLAYVSWVGPDSAVKEMTFLLADDAEAWVELWVRHMGGESGSDRFDRPNVPRIDFERCTVIAAFGGDSWNSDGYYIDSIIRTEGALIVRLDGHSYQTAGIDGGGVRVTPYGIFLLPRWDGEIVVEENTQGLIGKPPKWTERGRFKGRGG